MIKKKAVIILKLNTYDHTPRPQKGKTISVSVMIAAAFIYGIVGLLAAIYFHSSQWFLGLVVILIAMLTTAMVLAAKKDIEESYVELLGDDIHIVDYPLGIKKEKRITSSDITSAEICHAYSPKTKGYRFSPAGEYYIVFYNGKKYLFKIIYLPETKEIFKPYIK
jgi:hypothetical protein